MFVVSGIKFGQAEQGVFLAHVIKFEGGRSERKELKG